MTPRKEGPPVPITISKPVEEEMQNSLKGPPKMAGLSSFEYQMDSLKYHCALL